MEVAELIRAGKIPVGTQLPPQRDLAEAMGISPATVSGAWKQLRAYRMVSGERRGGTWVRGDQTLQRPLRYEDFANYGEHLRADLRYASPDPTLLPDLRRALASAHEVEHLHDNVHREAISKELNDAVLPSWPYTDCVLTAVNGGYDGLLAALEITVVPGGTVAVEDPTTLRVFDILEKLDARVVAVQCDDEGPMPDALAAALEQRPSSFIFQPGSHSLTGRRVSSRRMKQLHKVLAGTTTMIIELDGLSELASSRPLSLGASLADRTMHIRTFSKSLGADMRLAVMSSSSKVSDQIQAYRNFGEGWTSRLLQKTAAVLLTDPASLKQIENARSIYGQRRNALTEALAKRGVQVSSQDALCVWLPVTDQQYALVTLAARGIAVQPGSRFQVHPRAHIRVSTSCQIDDLETIADALAEAATTSIKVTSGTSGSGQ